ncbi:hypothetical protein EN858_06425 [Mesorhizobium sp. M4B.F.Ca.ET.215.01.1.1]|nr:hypothetical protein EOA34_06695 [Mesorhizobium sp. M4B.F.Ca.ET.013.02.1.1]RVD38548.1 hypothetical protein EN741_20905 [Mesorhizobium sp. M4B.F.Ca.ET.019.03.1.1]TGQ15469.1 hypothetical protein EN858_06425 [Mesorhizobium sp. M4B.F.Ca.ET.215.01.1.1]TGQ45578.1 hypothetical protein EN857_02550 [Mesorhizobium sp. M4B.F.Ca.ET.214.01.1.1]TGQ48322.1 hypothetical protein EN863_004240 [Mesorhizobium sp. M00.F.Ca.ET.220.01.1.1]TGQ63207.1 hypothetical protein EN854_02550 [Mesorhizobium sp. M4B.F.Ca.ET.
MALRFSIASTANDGAAPHPPAGTFSPYSDGEKGLAAPPAPPSPRPSRGEGKGEGQRCRQPFRQDVERRGPNSWPQKHDRKDRSAGTSPSSWRRPCSSTRQS